MASTLGKVYLFCYNAAQFVGWSYLLFLLATSPGFNSVYPRCAGVLQIFQTLALLEVVHAALGLVRSNTVLTAFQVSSRVFVTWAILAKFPTTAETSYGAPALLAAWSLTEVVRYSFYAMSLVGMSVYPLTWLRYTLFIALYPLGVTGELLCAYSALGPVKKERPFSMALPNTWNFTFDSYVVLVLIMLLYVPIFPSLYKHMFMQRRKVLGGGADKKQA